MRKANSGQVVGNLSTRGHLLANGKDSPTRRKAVAALEQEYLVARATCAKVTNHRNRKRVDGMQKRLIRRQRRTLWRNYLVRVAGEKEKIRNAKLVSEMEGSSESSAAAGKDTESTDGSSESPPAAAGKDAESTAGS